MVFLSTTIFSPCMGSMLKLETLHHPLRKLRHLLVRHAGSHDKRWEWKPRHLEDCCGHHLFLTRLFHPSPARWEWHSVCAPVSLRISFTPRRSNDIASSFKPRTQPNQGNSSLDNNKGVCDPPLGVQPHECRLADCQNAVGSLLPTPNERPQYCRI